MMLYKQTHHGQVREGIDKIFKEFGLCITITTLLIMVDLSGVTLDLDVSKFYPYKKPNEETVDIHNISNHPTTVIRNLDSGISK